MTTDPTSLDVLVSVANQVEATAIINALADRGIRASAVGPWASRLPTSAPGDVKIMVVRADLPRAAEALVDVRREFAEFDWSEVDIADDSSVEKERDPADVGGHGRRLQFGIATILIVQAVVSVQLAFWQAAHVDWMDRVASFAVHFTLLSAAMIALAVAGTVFIASDLSRVRRIVEVMVLAELAAFAVTGVVVLLSMALRLLGV